MGMAATERFCDGCGDAGAGVWLIDDKGQVQEGVYCWGCANERSTPIPRRLAAVLPFIDWRWLRSKVGATWLAQRIAAKPDTDWLPDTEPEGGNDGS